MNLTKGALVQYGDTFLGPIPNLFVFQYNVEELDRQFAIQRRHEESNVPARQVETHRAHSSPIESFALNIKLDATDDLDKGDETALGAVVDAVGSLLNRDEKAPTRSIPPETLPKLIFVGGLSRVLPVEVTSFSINETLFNSGLVAIRADVTLGLEVVTFPPDSRDIIGQGALEYMKTIKDAQAVLNIGKSITDAPDIIGF